MRIKDLMDNPDRALMYMERYVNDGSPSGFTWKNQTSESTSPRSANESFLLHTLYTDGAVQTLGEFPELTSNEGEHSILIHPDMAQYTKYSGLRIAESDVWVAPTASSRTVKLLNVPGYVKLNYNGIIGRIDRSLTDKHALASIELTGLLKRSLWKKDLYEGLTFLPEPGAKVYKDRSRDINFGIVYREERPYGKRAEKIKYIMPIFSLFSKDRNASDEYLLIQLIEESGRDPLKYLLEDFIFIIAENYFNLLLCEGLQPEWHAQNLLVGLDENFCIAAVIMRDLESIDIDLTLQERSGDYEILKSYPYKYLHCNQYNYQIKHSFMYDFKIGEYIFGPAIECVCRRYDWDAEKLQKEIKDFTDIFIKRLPEDFFPGDHAWYSFEKVLIDRAVKERPYIKNSKPKYRG